LISAIGVQLRLVGVIATFGNQILLQLNRRSLKDDSMVISLQYHYFWDA